MANAGKRSVNTGIKKKKRARSLTNMAKVICDKLATMTFSEQCDIAVSDKEYNDVVMDTLEANCFWERFPEFLSRSYALGGGVLKGYIENGEIGEQKNLQDGEFRKYMEAARTVASWMVMHDQKSGTS